jgi:hypothetical protein
VKSGKNRESGKVMRVATAFTGAAALVGAFAPGAIAGTAHRDAPRSTRRASRGCSGVPNWFHVYGTGPAPLYSPVCYGGVGSIQPDISAEGFCGGNNYGYWSGWDVQTNRQYRGPTRQNFGPGNYVYWFRGNQTKFPGSVVVISKITITKFNGTDTCPMI